VIRSLSTSMAHSAKVWPEVLSSRIVIVAGTRTS
jgi:hypothetical protein